MTRKNIIVLTVAFLAVAGFYIYLYRDSFRKPTIQISHTIRARAWALTHRAANASPDDPINIITFRLDNEYKLTDVKVVAVSALEFNKSPKPMWELISDSNSPPVNAFSYGARIRGMHPAVKGAKPSELDPNVPYRLFVQAGKISGQHDFTITEENHLAH